MQLKFWSYQPLIQVHQFRTLPAQAIERSGSRDTDAAADASDGRAGDFHAILSYLSIAVQFLLPSFLLSCPGKTPSSRGVRVSRVCTFSCGRWTCRIQILRAGWESKDFISFRRLRNGEQIGPQSVRNAKNSRRFIRTHISSSNQKKGEARERSLYL